MRVVTHVLKLVNLLMANRIVSILLPIYGKYEMVSVLRLEAVGLASARYATVVLRTFHNSQFT